jgi:hypothetical protein
MTARNPALLVSLCAFAVARAAAGAEIPANPVTVRIYQTPRLDPSVSAAALTVARQTLASALVDVSWKPCGAGPAVASCDRPPAGDLVVRIVRSTAGRNQSHLPLGDALIDSGSGTAVLATVYFDRVDRAAKAAHMEAAALLGYAVAHEIGHLLLASSAHSTRGLMRPIWRDDELRNRRTVDWEITELEVAEIRKRLGSAAHTPSIHDRVLADK